MPACPKVARSGRSLEAWVVEAAQYASFPTLRTCPWSTAPEQFSPAAANGLPPGAASPLYQKPSDTHAILINYSLPTSSGVSVVRRH
jgi:hypothetical protein